MNEPSREEMIPPRKFLRMCRRNMRRAKVADSSEAEMTGADLLTRSLILRRLLRREVLVGDEQHVGLLLPPSLPAVVANAALSVDKRIAVNLNYTASNKARDYAVEQCKLKCLISSRPFLKKLNIRQSTSQFVFIEDLITDISRQDKIKAYLQARFAKLQKTSPESIAAITGRESDIVTTESMIY